MVHILYMEITTKTTTEKTETPRRGAATSALAIVGFIVLIFIGIALAIYAARYVPMALNGLGSAAVSLFDGNGDGEPTLEVVSPDTTLPFEPVATSTEVTISEPVVTPAPTAPANGGTAQPGTPTTVQVPVYVPPAAPYGKADLTVDITATGYCSSDKTSSFRSAREVPDGENGGFQFTVANRGTNVSGQWDLTYELPTTPALERTASNQRSLKPGDRLSYTICFTEPRSGSNRDITIRVDSGRDVNESNENNNSDTAEIDIDN
jgi:hypothetical protein